MDVDIEIVFEAFKLNVRCETASSNFLPFLFVCVNWPPHTKGSVLAGGFYFLFLRNAKHSPENLRRQKRTNSNTYYVYLHNLVGRQLRQWK